MFEIEVMQPGDVERAVGWAAAEGWNPGLADASAYRAADAGGFLMGRLDGEPVTAISAMRYGRGFGFIGFYIVQPAHRGKGLGLRTWQAAMAQLEGRIIGLDGVVAQQENYRKSGFVLAHRNVRYGGRLALAPLRDPRIRSVTGDMASAVIAYDAPFFPDSRSAFLSAWLDGSGGRRALALVEDGAIRGYGVIRPAVTGFKIGPLFADDEAGADLLFRALAAEAGDSEIFLDPPGANPAALALVARYGLAPAFETARMYRGGDPALPLSHIFGITSFEIG